MNKSLFLTICLLLAGPAGAQPAPPGDGKLQITVIPLPCKDLTPGESDEILSLLSGQLRQLFRAQVLSGRSVGRSVWGELDDFPRAQAAVLQRKVDEAFQAYRTLDLDKALRLLEEAERALQFAGAELNSPEPVRKLYFFRGLVELGLGRQKEAQASFQKAAAVDIKFQPAADKFAPRIRQVFKAARDGLVAGGGYRLSLLSKPEGARVTVDGVQKGATPLEIELFPGPHFVRLELEEHALWTVNIPAEARPKEIKARLVRRWMDQPPKDLLEKTLGTVALEEEELAVLRLLSGLFRSDALLLVGLNLQERNVLLGLRLFISRPESVGKARLFNLGQDPQRWDQKLRGVVSTLDALARLAPPPPAVVAAPQPAPGPFVMSSAPSTSAQPVPEPWNRESSTSTRWYRSWWFWTAVGVAVAGAAAGTTIWLTRPADSWKLIVKSP